jgi:hypothetical protein
MVPLLTCMKQGSITNKPFREGHSRADQPVLYCFDFHPIWSLHNLEHLESAVHFWELLLHLQQQPVQVHHHKEELCSPLRAVKVDDVRDRDDLQVRGPDMSTGIPTGSFGAPKLKPCKPMKCAKP